MPKQYKTITKRSSTILNKPEGIDVDFKEEISGLKTEDLVAFANSVDGGIILIGVQELETKEGQKGKIIGCNIADKDVQHIINKAESCSPPVEVEVVLENVSRKPFIRVEIPPGKNKPYSTRSGVYKIRGDGQNLPITPSRLLSMLLEQEGELFFKRFQDATHSLVTDIEYLDHQIREINEQLIETWGMTEDAQVFSEAALEIAEATAQDIEEIKEKIVEPRIIENLDLRLKAILSKLNIEDPVKLADKERMGLLFKYQYDFYKDNENYFKLQIMNAFPHLSAEEFSTLYEETKKEYLNN